MYVKRACYFVGRSVVRCCVQDPVYGSHRVLVADKPENLHLTTGT